MTEREIWTRKLRLGDVEPNDALSMTPSERVRLVWTLTVQAWTFKEGRFDAPGLRRDVVRVVRGGG